MNDLKHTPGDWWINDRESDEESISIAADEQEHYRIGYAIDDWGDPEQMKANAFLFAASSKMLTALEDAAEWMQEQSAGEEWVKEKGFPALDNALAAIAKAKKGD